MCTYIHAATTTPYTLLYFFLSFVSFMHYTMMAFLRLNMKINSCYCCCCVCVFSMLCILHTHTNTRIKAIVHPFLLHTMIFMDQVYTRYYRTFIAYLMALSRSFQQWTSQPVMCSLSLYMNALLGRLPARYTFSNEHIFSRTSIYSLFDGAKYMSNSDTYKK